MTASPQITFTTLAGHYRFPCPEWGYASVVNTALIHHPVLPQGYEVWDNGAVKDYRTCRCVFTLNATAANTMNALFREAGYGRGVNATLTLPAGSGFYPFGPDCGDAGAFTVRIVSYKPGKQLEEPFNHFRNELSMVCTAFPAYVLPAQVDEGELTIGAVTTLRWPDDWSDSESMYDVTTQLTRNGTPYSVDKNVNRYETALAMICRQNKAAALINHLVATVRDANVAITPPTGTYLFGRDNAAAAYTCQWLDEEVEIIHRSFDRFEFALHFYMVP